MQLTINDNLSTQCVDVSFISDRETITYSISEYEFPATSNFTRAMEEYYVDHVYCLKTEFSGNSTSARIIEFGKRLGDSLLGEDFELTSIKEKIELLGYENLDVEIVSQRDSFHHGLWETLILPDSAYVLSAVAKSFRRTASPNQNDINEIRFELNVPTSIPAVDHSQPDTNKDEHEPLYVLHLVARPGDPKSEQLESYVYRRQGLGNCGGNSIVYVDVLFESEKKLREIVRNIKHPLHILHIDIPFGVEEGELYGVSNSEQQVAFAKVLECLGNHKFGAMFVEPLVTSSCSAFEIFTKSNEIALKHSIDNVIGCNILTDVSVSAECFDELYRKIALGFELGQAVVETRKSLQEINTIARFSEDEISLQRWPLLTHFGTGQVTYFSAPQAEVGQEIGANFAEMYGFDSPLGQFFDSPWQYGSIYKAWEKLEKNRVLLAHGESGQGKSVFSYFLAHNTLLKEKVQRVFYFDFRVFDYSLENLQSMIEPVVFHDEECSWASAFKNETNLFVFDHVECLNTPQNLRGILRFLDSHEQKSLLVTNTSNKNSISNTIDHAIATYGELELPPLSIRLYKLWLYRNKAETKKLGLFDNLLSDNLLFDNIEKIYTSTHASLWLTKRLEVISSSSLENTEKPISILNRIDWSTDAPIQNQYYALCWPELSLTAQRLLLLCSSDTGIVLEMLRIASERDAYTGVYKELCQLLSVPFKEFSLCMEEWEKYGFIESNNVGSILAVRAVHWIKLNLDPYKLEEHSKLKMAYSQWVCGALFAISKHLAENDNTALLRYVINERRCWSKHMETLWQQQDWQAFSRVKNSFDVILHKTQLFNESLLWCAKLIDMKPAIYPGDLSNTVEDRGLYIWLSILNSALSVKEFLVHAKTHECLEEWDSWVKNSRKFSPLKALILRVLERYYHVDQKWACSLAVLEVATESYRDIESWTDLTHCYQSIAYTQRKLGNIDKALETEERLLSEVPFSEGPRDFKIKTFVDIVSARIQSQQLDGAAQLLNQLKAITDEMPQFVEIVAHLEKQIAAFDAEAAI